MIATRKPLSDSTRAYIAASSALLVSPFTEVITTRGWTARLVAVEWELEPHALIATAASAAGARAWVIQRVGVIVRFIGA